LILTLDKHTRYRNQAVLDVARHVEECLFCGKRDGTVVAAHSNQSRHGKGGGLKAHDCFVAYLCHACHDAVDAARTDNEVATYIWEAAHQRSVPIFRHLLDSRGKRILAGLG
jgi:hypothetical protein